MGLRNQNNYLSKLTDNSVKNIDREPVGENCADICDKNGPLTLKIFQAEHGMSSLYSCTGQILCQVCTAPIMACVANLNSFMYGDIMYYVHHTPVFDMNHENPENPRVQMGIAYCSIPRDGQRQPKTFVCNVGHLESPSMQDCDWLQTNMHTYRMVKHLANDPRAGEKGFVTDVICEFWSPLKKGQSQYKKDEDRRHIRQVNLSAWTDPKSAHDW